jgi:hypothetical protein
MEYIFIFFFTLTFIFIELSDKIFGKEIFDKFIATTFLIIIGMLYSSYLSYKTLNKIKIPREEKKIPVEMIIFILLLISMLIIEKYITIIIIPALIISVISDIVLLVLYMDHKKQRILQYLIISLLFTLAQIFHLYFNTL